MNGISTTVLSMTAFVALPLCAARAVEPELVKDINPSDDTDIRN